MKIKSEIIWATLLIGTAVLFFYLGNKTGTLKAEETLNSNIKEKAEQITALENKLQQISEELISRGIYSYPQANVVSEKNDAKATIVINLNGREIIKDLEIERRLIIDYSSNPEKKLADLERKGTKAYIGNLNAHNPVAFEIGEFEKELVIDLTFTSERNLWHQYIVAKKNPDGEIKSFWVITNGESEVIDKHIDEGFPTGHQGNLLFGGHKVNYSEIRMNAIFKPLFIKQDHLE